MTVLEQARDLFRNARGMYQERKQRCEQVVGSWEWSAGITHVLEPCFFEIFGVPRGRRLDQAPVSPRAGLRLHGLDGARRCVVTRVFNDSSGRFEEDLVLYDWPIGQRIRFLDNKGQQPLRADVFRYQSQIEEIGTVTAFGAEYTQTFSYENRLVTAIEKHGIDERGVRIDEVYMVQSDEDGEVDRILLTRSDGSKSLIFSRPSATGSFAAHRSELLVAMRDAAIRKLASMTFSSDVYAVALSWFGAEYYEPLPSWFSVGTVRERDEAIAKHGRKKAIESYVWCPENWSDGFNLDLSRRVQKTIELVNRELRREEHGPDCDTFRYELAAAISKELTRLRLPVRRTAELVCYATALDEGEGRNEMKRQTPQAIQDVLRKRKLL